MSSLLQIQSDQHRQRIEMLNPLAELLTPYLSSEKVQNIIDTVFKNLLNSDYMLEEHKSKFQDVILSIFTFAFYLRDCRGGCGMRENFYYIFLVLSNVFPSMVSNVLNFIPEYGYFKDYFNLLRLCRTQKSINSSAAKEIKDNILNIIVKQLKEDDCQLALKSTADGQQRSAISFCAKYCPREGKSFNSNEKKLFHELLNRLYPDIPLLGAKIQYRKLLVRLCQALPTQQQLDDFHEDDYHEDKDENGNNYEYTDTVATMPLLSTTPSDQELGQQQYISEISTPILQKHHVDQQQHKNKFLPIVLHEIVRGMMYHGTYQIRMMKQSRRKAMLKYWKAEKQRRDQKRKSSSSAGRGGRGSGGRGGCSGRGGGGRSSGRGDGGCGRSRWALNDEDDDEDDKISSKILPVSSLAVQEKHKEIELPSLLALSVSSKPPDKATSNSTAAAFCCSIRSESHWQNLAARERLRQERDMQLQLQHKHPVTTNTTSSVASDNDHTLTAAATTTTTTTTSITTASTAAAAAGIDNSNSMYGRAKFLTTVNLRNMVGIVDTSGTMHGRPIEVALALTLFASESQCIPSLQHRVLSFDTHPQWISLRKASSATALPLVTQMRRVLGTPTTHYCNLQLVLTILAHIFVQEKLTTPMQVPDVVIFSNRVCLSETQESIFRSHAADHSGGGLAAQLRWAKEYFERLHVPMPRIIYWNLRDNLQDQQQTVCLAGAAFARDGNPAGCSMFRSISGCLHEHLHSHLSPSPSPSSPFLSNASSTRNSSTADVNQNNDTNSSDETITTVSSSSKPTTITTAQPSKMSHHYRSLQKQQTFSWSALLEDDAFCVQRYRPLRESLLQAMSATISDTNDSDSETSRSTDHENDVLAQDTTQVETVSVLDLLREQLRLAYTTE